MTIPESARGSTRKCPSCDRAVTAPVFEGSRPAVAANSELSFWAVGGLASVAVIAAVVFVCVGMSRTAPREARSAVVKQDAPVAAVKKSVDVAEKPAAARVERQKTVIVEKTRPPVRKAVAAKAKAPVRKPAKTVVTRVSESTLTIDWPALKPFNANARWSVPKLSDANYQKWIKHVQPTKEDLKWRNIRWHKSLSVAAAEAKKLNRPILLWTMNGHPCGET